MTVNEYWQILVSLYSIENIYFYKIYYGEFTLQREAIMCVCNQQSNSGKNMRLLPIIEAAIQKHDLPYAMQDIAVPDLDQQILRFIEKNENPVIIAAGGDGTFHSVANAFQLIKLYSPTTQLPAVAILPLGTGNDIAKSFGVPVGIKNVEEQVRIAIHGNIIDADLIKTDDKYFMDVFSIGIDTEILASRDHIMKNGFLKGYTAYAWAFLKTIFKCQSHQINIKLDGAAVFNGKAYGVLVNNCEIHAGEFSLTPKASHTSGELDLLIFDTKLRYLSHYLIGHRKLPPKYRHHQSPLYLQGKATLMQFEEELSYQLDGEVVGKVKDISLKIQPGILKVCVPNKH
ncbi:MAG: hypothetical protein MK193_01925 [Lentisphaeria bacterium]|nr:hypothetical protein [Lentisphaeria bacterium]